jgi:hypothetical protein
MHSLGPGSGVDELRIVVADGARRCGRPECLNVFVVISGGEVTNEPLRVVASLRLEEAKAVVESTRLHKVVVAAPETPNRWGSRLHIPYDYFEGIPTYSGGGGKGSFSLMQVLLPASFAYVCIYRYTI